MADQIEQVSEQGFGSSLMESIKGVAIGGLLFFASFWVLWMNEGRVDLSEVARQSAIAKADSVDKAQEGKFISVTGELKVEGKIDDPDYLAPGEYIRLERQAEMYAWFEKKSTEKKKKVGGSKEIKETYTYEKKWTDEPWPPSKFQYPKDHENPPLTVESKSWSATKAQVAAYPFKPEGASLPSGEQLRISDDMLKSTAPKAEGDKPAGEGDKADADKPKEDGDKAKEDGDKKDDEASDDGGKKKKKSKKRKGRKIVRNKPSAAEKAAAANKAETKAAAIASSKPTGFVRANDTYLFQGTGSVESPEIGDVRIGWKALKGGGEVTIFGQLKDGEVQPYVGKDDVKMFRVLKGSRVEAINQLASEHKTTTWFLRILGFVMMWVGLMMFFGPINALLDVIPFLGSAGRFLIGLVMFPVSLLLSTFTVLLSVIAHNTFLLVGFLVAIAAGGYFLYRKKKKG